MAKREDRSQRERIKDDLVRDTSDPDVLAIALGLTDLSTPDPNRRTERS